ncbi:MAG TPA: GIY-YIG nuclease family protein [Candidatus Angelobacter sp.]
MRNTYFTYILSNKSRRVYVGSTSELQARVFKHKKGWYEGSFTARYNFDMLVYFETFSHPREMTGADGFRSRAITAITRDHPILQSVCPSVPYLS